MWRKADGFLIVSKRNLEVEVLGFGGRRVHAHVYMHACEFAWMSIGIYFAVLFPGHTHLLIPDKVFDIC